MPTAKGRAKYPKPPRDVLEKTYKEIRNVRVCAAVFRVSHGTFTSWLKEEEIAINPKGKRCNADIHPQLRKTQGPTPKKPLPTKDELAELYSELKSGVKIAAFTGISRPIIYRLLNQYDLIVKERYLDW